MKKLICILFILGTNQALAFEGTQYSLGVGQLDLAFEGASTDWNTPVLGVTYKTGPDNRFGFDGGFRIDGGYNSGGGKNLLFGSLLGEFGLRWNVTKIWSLSAHALVGTTLVNYKNDNFSLHQLNELKGALLAYGWNVETNFTLDLETQIGFRLERRYQKNLGSGKGEINMVTPSVFVLWGF